MDIGQAVAAMRAGNRVTRAGWNGKNMSLFYMPGYPDGVAANVATASALGIPLGSPVIVRPYVSMRTVDGSIVPWLCSQSDLLADDWMVVA